jgi:coenzyme F420-reducing hydrogenase alpha subunit
MAMLHAPDFLGVHDAIELARSFPQQVQLALALKKTGNAMVSLLGGREIHPINVRVGGFYRLPAMERLTDLRAQLEGALQQAIALTRWVADLDHPDFDRVQEPYLFVALRGEREYPMYEGRLASSDGVDIDADAFEAHFHERQIPYSNALHSMTSDGRAYLVGPLARFNLNFDRLAAPARALAEELGFRPPCINPFQSIVIRGLEVVHAVAEAIRLLDGYRAPDAPWREAAVRAGRGCAITEAPRGILYHRYEIDGDGRIRSACIVPPTSQNQKTIEDDLRLMLPPLLGMDHDLLRHRCEQAIRNYDPCISCATHFLRLTLERS